MARLLTWLTYSDVISLGIAVNLASSPTVCGWGWGCGGLGRNAARATLLLSIMRLRGLWLSFYQKIPSLRLFCKPTLMDFELAGKSVIIKLDMYHI